MRILFKNLLLNKIIMSRRTAPTAGRQQQQRTPQPSIKSSQVFAPQPTREQTQYQQMNAKKQLQQQQMKNYQQDYNEEYSEKQNVTGITKMTIAQAITLITLRLGSVETKLMNSDFGSNVNNNIDEETLVNVSNRLDSLESKINLSSSSDYKQQIDHLTQAIIQSKNFSNTLMKENKELKTQFTNLKKEMTDVKQLIENVKNIAMSNENKIFQMLNVSSEFQLDENFNLEDENEIKMDNETEFNLSDSEHSILETDIRQTLENNENEESQITQIENL
jgi:hypothetical protein